jgi:hypothetical protein
MSKNKGFTSQGIRNLNHNFGPPVKRSRELPDDCTLGLHLWGQWTNGYPFPDYRTCEECQETEYYQEVSKEAFNPIRM